MKNDPFDFSGIRLVSWDVDGTVFSYFRLALALLPGAVRHAQSHGWSYTARELQQLWHFHKSVEIQRRQECCRVLADELQGFADVQDLEKHALHAALKKIRPRKQVVALLKTFAARGTCQVALSDFECQYKLEALGIREYFQKAYVCRHIGFWKPSPVPLSVIQKEFDVCPQQHLHIGDRRDADGEACFKNGCHFLPIANAV